MTDITDGRAYSGMRNTHFLWRPITIVDIWVQDMAPMSRALVTTPRAHGCGYLCPVGAILFHGLNQLPVLFRRPCAL